MAYTQGIYERLIVIFILENSSLHGDFLNKYPGPATSSSTLDLQQKSLLEEQQKRLDTFQDTAHNFDKENLKSFGNKAVSTGIRKDVEFHSSVNDIICV